MTIPFRPFGDPNGQETQEEAAARLLREKLAAQANLPVGVAPPQPVGVMQPQAPMPMAKQPAAPLPAGLGDTPQQPTGGWGQQSDNPGNMQVAQGVPDDAAKILLGDLRRSGRMFDMNSPESQERSRQALNNIAHNDFIAAQTGNYAMSGSGAPPVLPHGWRGGFDAGQIVGARAGAPPTAPGGGGDLGPGMHFPRLGGSGVSSYVPTRGANGQMDVEEIHRPYANMPPGEYNQALAADPNRLETIRGMLNKQIGVAPGPAVGLALGGPAAQMAQQPASDQQRLAALDNLFKERGQVSPLDKKFSQDKELAQMDSQTKLATAAIASAVAKHGSLTNALTTLMTQFGGDATQFGSVVDQLNANLNRHDQSPTELLRPFISIFGGKAPVGVATPPPVGVAPGPGGQPMPPGLASKTPEELARDEDVRKSNLERERLGAVGALFQDPGIVTRAAPTDPKQPGNPRSVNIPELIRRMSADTRLMSSGPAIKEQLLKLGLSGQDVFQKQIATEWIRNQNETGGMPVNKQFQVGPLSIQRNKPGFWAQNRFSVRDASGKELAAPWDAGLPFTGYFGGTQDLFPTTTTARQADYRARLSAAENLLRSMGQ